MAFEAQCCEARQIEFPALSLGINMILAEFRSSIQREAPGPPVWHTAKRFVTQKQLDKKPNVSVGRVAKTHHFTSRISTPLKPQSGEITNLISSMFSIISGDDSPLA